MAVLFDQVSFYYYFNILALLIHNYRYIPIFIGIYVRYHTFVFFYRPAAVEAEKKAFMSDVAQVSTLLIQSGEIYKCPLQLWFPRKISHIILMILILGDKLIFFLQKKMWCEILFSCCVSDPDPNPDPHVLSPRILLSSSKNCKENLDSYCFVTCFGLFIFERWCKCTFKK